MNLCTKIQRKNDQKGDVSAFSQMCLYETIIKQKHFHTNCASNRRILPGEQSQLKLKSRWYCPRPSGEMSKVIILNIVIIVVSSIMP